MQASIFRLPDVKLCVGLSKSQIYEMVKRRQFPAPFKICGARASGWDAEAVRRWAAARIESSRNAEHSGGA